MEKDRVLELLEAANWDDIVVRLTYYAASPFRRYGWKSDLPKGNSPDDVAISAIEKVWDGTRDWDPDKYPDLLTHLKWIVKSDIDHLFSSLEHKTTGRMPVLIKDNGTEVELGETACEHLHSISGKVLTPEEKLIVKQKKELEKALIAELHDAVKGDDDLELLLLCFEEGIDKPETIAIETEWDINKVYNLKRKLLRKAAKIGKKNYRDEGGVMEKDKTLIQSFYNFLEDTEGLTDEDLAVELKGQGIDVSTLKKRVAEVVRRGSEKRRLAWRKSAQKKRSEIEKLLERMEPASISTDLKSKIKDILAGYYGQGALSYVETYFRKKDALTEKDLESLIEDLEDLNLLDKSGKKG